MATQQSPHVLLITCDQLRKDALSCYGATAVQTPHLDRLAATGTRYDRAYTASPWCMPSRSSILTGLLPHRHGAYSNFRDAPLAAEVPNLYQLLSGCGYVTSHIGKCHYAPVPYAETRPDETQDYEKFRDYYLSLGIDHLELQDDKQVSVWFRDDYAAELDDAGWLAAYRDAVWDSDKQKVFSFPAPAEWHPDAWVGRKAAERIDAVSASDPQFVWVSFSGPHFPFDPPSGYLDRVEQGRIPRINYAPGEFTDSRRIHHRSFHGPPPTPIESGVNSAYTMEYWQRLRHHYLANVALIDDMVGEIVSAAEQRFGDTVLVVFTADHGEMLGNHWLWGKSDCFYEDVLNVPLLTRWPGQDDGRVERDTRRMTVDIFPTVLECVGVACGDIDGRSMLSDASGHGLVIAEGEGFITFFDGRYKMVRINRPGQDFLEFFDLQVDPHEYRNVADNPDYSVPLGALRQSAIDVFLRDLLP